MKKYLLLCFILALSILAGCKEDNNDPEVSQSENAETQSITLSIDEIEDDYFLAQHPWASPLRYKVYTDLEDDYCVGDYVDVYFDEMTESGTDSFELTATRVEMSDFELKEGVSYKPVIYLYPTKETEVSVTLDYNGSLTHTNPSYQNGWNVTAYPDGTLIDDSGEKYPYLFWEGESDASYDMSKGFCISGAETEQFLRDKLTFMGLNEKEAEDFLEFWVPWMEKNIYNKISFQTTAYTDNAKLTVVPKPDSVLRIYMVFQPLEEYIEMEEQELGSFERRGFTVVEWGGEIQR